MSSLHTLPKIITKELRRGGQGHGSGRGKTAGRGTKGQKARNKVAPHFEGGALPLTKRLPFLRGKGRNKAFVAKPTPINIASLAKLPANTVVDEKILVEHNLVSEKEVLLYGVKILGFGELNHALTVTVPVSKQAAEKIEKVGGSIA